MVSRGSKAPMWSPKLTSETIPDIPAKNLGSINHQKLWISFFIAAGLVVFAGYLVGEAGIAITKKN